MNIIANKLFYLTILAITLTFSTPLFAAGDPVAGEAKSATCVACHGEQGISVGPNVPHLAGQYEKYIIQRVNEFLSRDHVDKVMHGVANLVINPQDIADIAAYYASLPRATQKITNQALYDNGKIEYSGLPNCLQCHGPTGEGVNPTTGNATPLIAGQQKEYLIKSLKDFKSGARDPKEAYMMRMICATLSDETIEALAEYLSSL